MPEPVHSKISDLVNLEDIRTYWNNQPCNIKHSNKVFLSEEYFKEVSARRYFVEPHIVDFADFSSWNGKSVLEVGCGIGTDGAEYSKAGAKYTGIELSDKSLEIAKERFRLFGLKGDLFQGNAEDLSFIRGQKFDLVYSFGVLHHTLDISKSIREISSICHENTSLKLMVYARNSWKQAMINAGLDQPEAQKGCPIAHVFTNEEIETILNQCGFKINKISQAHIFQFNVEKYKQFVYERNHWFECMPDEMIKALQEQLGWHLLIDASPI